MRKYRLTSLISLFTLILLAAMTTACYTGGRIEVRSVPAEAYVYIDGTPVADGTASGDNNIIVDDLKPGEYTVSIYNYGYKSQEQKVTVQEGKTAYLGVDLTPEVGQITGPWGRIVMEGPPHAAVLMNGKTPAFLVGHVDEFDKDLFWRGELVVPPGTHQVTVLDQGTTVWSGPVTVAANQTVNVDVKAGGKQTTSNWPEGGKISSLQPLKASVFSAHVAVLPVKAQLSAIPTEVSCGGSSRLTWSSSGTVADQISDVGEVPASGDREVQPKQTTTYKLTAAGPGGIVTPDATVTVNPVIQASLSISPAEVSYHKVGDKVEQQDSATLNWSAAGADSASIDPLGSVGTSGNRTIQANPSKTALGPVDETVTYTLRAANVCGGTETRTASLHIKGSIESGVNLSELEAKFNVNSIYFPTNLPTKARPNVGLVPTDDTQLNDVLAFFKQFLGFQPDAHLILEGNADVRGSNTYNDALSQRRADIVKNYLVNQQVPAANLDTRAFGKRQNLTRKEVFALIDQNPNLTPRERKRIKARAVTYWWANNRRVDVKLGAAGPESHRNFPYNSPDAKKLLVRGIYVSKQPAKTQASETKK